MADGTGAWSFTPAGLVDGVHTLSASQTDLAGSTGTATLGFTLDRAAPVLFVNLIADTGISATDKITANPGITGKGDANALVTIKEGIKLLGTTMADATGAWSFTPIGLPEGTHTYGITQTDLAGNTGSTTKTFTLDSSQSSLPLVSVLSIDLVSDTGISATDKITSNPGIKGTGQANTLVTIKEGGVTLGTTTADGSGAWSFTPAGLTNGAHTLTATQTDLAGNTTTATQSFTLDKAAPLMSMALVSDTGASATDKITSNPTIKGTADANTLVTIKEGGTTLGTVTANSTGNWSFTPTGLSDGPHTFSATQTDLAGNTGTATLSFTLDKTAPVVSMMLLSDTGSSPTDKITSNPAVNGLGQANTLVTVKEGGATLGTTTADGTGAWSFTPIGLVDGVHTLSATQTDLAGNTGIATLSFTLDTRPPQPSQSGDIVGLLLQNTGATAEQSGYVTFGQVFKPGAIMPGESLVARIAGVDYAVQMDVKATNSDGSVRHAVLTLSAPGIALGGSLALMLAKGSAAMPSPAAPSAASLLASGYNLDVAFTFRNADGTTTTDNASAAAALQAAITAGNVQRWLTGPEVNEYSVVTTVNGGKLKVEFDIRAYADGTTSTDVIFDNSWMFSPGKSDLTYDVAIRQGGTQVYSANNVSQYLYSLWDHRVDSAGTINPNVQYDVSYLTAAAALPTYDQSYGVSSAAIQTNYSKLNPSSSTGYGSTGPLGTAEVQPVMGNAGGRPDIGPQPNWVAQWVLSQSSTATAVMIANANASGSIPWHLLDENTGTLIRSTDYPYFWQSTANSTGNPYWSPQPVNGWPTYGANGDPWKPDTAHMPDLNYVPYLITGSQYQLQLLQAAADYAITSFSPYSNYNGFTSIDPMKPGNAVFMGVTSPRHEERAIAWGLREVAEAAYLTPDGDPLKTYFTSQLTKALSGMVRYYITDHSMAEYGDLQGFVLGSETASGGPIVSTWQEGYIVTALAEIAGMNLPQVSDDAVRMLNYMTNFVAGLYTNGENGFAPANGSSYWLYLKDVQTNAPFTTWSEFSDGNVVNHQITGSPYGLATPNPEKISDSIAKYHMTDGEGWVMVGKAALADLITYTQSPRAIEAYGYVVSQIALAWGGDTAGMAAMYRDSPWWNVAPRLPDGEYLQANQVQVDVSNNPSVTLSATNRDALLSVVGTGTATLTGGTGSIDLLFGGDGPTTLIAGTGNDFLFAGNGATTFIDNDGNDYMKGGPGTDTFTFADIHPGHDTIVNFKVGTDVLKIASGVDGTSITSATQLAAAASVVAGATVLHLGPNHDVTIQGIDTPSALLSSIAIL